MNIIYGGSGSGKSRWVYQELKKHKGNLSREISLIVPEQFTLETEQEYLQETGESGILGFEITSFTHMMQQVVQAYQPGAKYWMNDLGKVLLLDQVLKQCAEDIGPLKRLGGKPRLLQAFYQDLLDGKWQSEELQRIVADAEEEGNELTDKLKALQHLLLQYESALADDGLVDEVVYLQIVCELIRFYQPFRSAILFIDQFWGFSTLELELIQVLSEQAEEITVLLTMETESDSRIFEPVRATRKSLLQKFPDAKERPFQKTNDIGRPFFELNRAWMDTVEASVQTDARIISAMQAEEEVRFCASKFLEWRELGIPFEEMQLVVSDYSEYLPLIRRTFQQSGIPVHLDHNRKIADYPAAQAVLYFLRFQDYGGYDDFLASVKSGYFGVRVSDIDRLELNVKQRGWIRSQEWQRVLLTQELLKSDRLVLLLREGSKRRKRARVEKHWETLCAILKQGAYFERFQQRDKGLAQEAFRIEHRSIWRGFQLVIDQMIAMYGETPIPARRFREQFALGCELIRVGVLPAVCGEATVRDFIRSRSTEKRCTIFLGMNEGKFPVTDLQDGFFDFEEREWLAEHEMKMGSTRNFQMQMQDLALYQIVSKTNEKLILMWSRKDQNFDDQVPSGLLVDLGLGKNGIATRAADWKDLLRAGGETQRFCRRIFRRMGDGKAVTEEQREMAIELFHRLCLEKQREMMTLLHYGNQVSSLDVSIAGKLYGNDETSITELELQNQCPFAHFLTYGIQPSELKPYRIEDPDVGQVMHDLMELAYEGVERHQISVESLEADFQRLADPYFEAYREGLFQTSQTNQFISRQIRESILASLRQLIVQKERSRFKTMGQEVRFGNQPGDLEPIRVAVRDGRDVSVCGRIDRVDQFYTEDELYMQVVDYKSGRLQIEREEMMGGIHLQLPTYMNVCRQNQPSMVPAGFFHYYLDRPIPTVQQRTGLEEQIRDFYRMRGIFLADPKMIVGMDESLLETGVSNAVAVRLKKDGSIQKSSQMIPRDQMEEILDRNLACIEETVQKIHQGEIRISPYQRKQTHACEHCRYGAICQFDTNFTENASRGVPEENEGGDSYEVD